MGGHPYWYFVPHRADVQAALDGLREREFRAGRYHPVVSDLDFDDQEALLALLPGAEHDDIDDAVEAASADGTRSILDIEVVDDEPGYSTASPFPARQIQQALGTATPTRAQVEDGLDDLIGEIERGHCLYLTVYADGAPRELFFAGYSYD